MDNSISNCDDIIDSREVQLRINDIHEQIDEETSGGECVPDDIRDELDELVKLREQAQPYSDDWDHGTELVRDSYFEEYAQALAEDIGATAYELKMDYTEVLFDDVTYWLR